MTSKLTLVVGLTALSLSPLCANNTATALNHHPDSTQMLGDVVVLADMRRPIESTRSKVPLSKLPLSISKINVQSLLSQGYINVPDAIRFVPAASFHTTYGAFYQLQVRGFDYTPIIVDGMRDERSTINSYPLSDLSDVEHIEVLKGPASVLQGHSSEGGLLSITRRRATAERSFRTRTELGSWGHFYNTTSLNGKITNHLNGLVGFSHKSGKGWRETNDKRFKLYGTLSGNWAHDALDLRISYNRDFYGTEAGLAPILFEDIYRAEDNKLFLGKGQVQPRIARSARFNNQSDEMWHKGFNATLKWTHNFNAGLRLTEQASFNDDLIDYFSTEGLNYRKEKVGKDKLPTLAPYPYYYDKGNDRFYIDMDNVQLNEPLRFAHRAKMLQNQLGLDGSFHTGRIKHNFAVGYDMSIMWRTSFTGYNDDDVFGPGKNSLVSVSNPQSMGYMQHKFSMASPNKTFDHGFYAQDVLDFDGKLQAMLALRYDLYRYSTAKRVPTKGGVMEYDYPASGDFSYINSSALSYRFGLVYSPVKTTNIYASISSIFKPEKHGVDDRYTYINKKGEVFTPSNNSKIFDPRTGFQTELGVRSKVGHWLTADVSAFYIKLNNVVKNFTQKEEDSASGKTISKRYRAQIGGITSKGFEASLTLTPVHGLSLTAGYSLTDVRYAKVADNKFIKEDIATGQRLNYVPMHQYFSVGSYHFGDDFLGAELHYNYSYTGKRKTGGKLTLEGYGLLDLGTSFRLVKGLRLGVDVYNVFNVKTYTSLLNGVQPFPNAPTNVKVHISYRL